MQSDPHQNLHTIEDYNLEEGKTTKYRKGNFLGKGGFARCYEIYPQNSQQPMAVKIIQKSSLVKQRSKQKLVSQIKIHGTLNHHNVVKFIHQFEDNTNVYILLQLCTNKVYFYTIQSLNDLIKRKLKLNQSQVRYYMLQLLDGLDYLHAHKIIHRDLKLGNLFINQNMQLKIGDFGLATRLDFVGEKRRTICGTPNYIAPQILQSKGHSYQVDIWSLGIIIFTLIYGKPPFQSKDVKETYKKIKLGIFTFPDSMTVSAAVKSVIKSCLQKDPSKRPTIKDLKGLQFFKGPILSRQPSLSFKGNTFSMKERDQREMSDNAKLYTNNDLVTSLQSQITSKDTPFQKSQDKFIITERSNASVLKSNQMTLNGKRSASQRLLKDTSSKNLQPILNNHNKINSVIVEVKKWIDYSSKYGIGYLLSNGHFGVYFNDSTKLIAFNQNQFWYFEKIDGIEVEKIYNFNEYPTELKKKVSLFNHFKGYLNESQNIIKFSQINQTNNNNDIVYVKKWFRSKHAVIFRLSNKSVQVIFIDQSQLLINASIKQVNYMNKNKQRYVYSLPQIMQSQNRQLIKRFEYTKQVLNEMGNYQKKK